MATKDVGNLRTRLSWEDDGANRSLKDFRRDLKGLSSELNAAKSKGREYTQSLKGLREQSDILTRRFKTQQETVKELKRRYEESKRVKGEDAEQTKNLSAQYNNAVAQMNKTEQQLKRVTSAIEEQVNPWKQLGRNLNDTGEKFQSFGQKMSQFGRDYSMKVTAPIVAGGTAMFKASMDFESAFTGVAKTFSGTDEQLAQLRKGIRDMAKEIPASTTEISAVAEAAGQLGIKAESIEEFTRTMIDLGEATNLTSDQAATEFARFANIVGMSQDDFDKLGSSVVSLGNSMATTEAEISSMAMRLAAQGKQVGMSEAQIMALAATMSSLGIEAEAGGTAMTTVLKKIQSAVDAGGKNLEGFANAARMSSGDFAKVWKEEPVKALDMFIKGLSQSSNEGQNLTSILNDLGIKGIREADTILRMAGASDLLSDAVDTSTKAWKENVALSNEASTRYATTESKLKILWNRIKDVAIQLGDALVPAVMDAIDAAEPFIKKIENGAKAFSDMSKEQQQSILKMIAFVAAIGPASVGLGALTSGIGGVLKVGGSLASMLGTAKAGTGLLASISGLGMAGPVGLAVVGVGLLTAGVVALTKSSKKNVEQTFEELESRQKQIEKTDELIARYDQLNAKNRLTTDEMLRYLDIQTELEKTSLPDKVKELTDEQQKLLDKSGLTNDEMTEFIGINEKIIKQAPTTNKAISEQGNAYATTSSEIKKVNKEKLESLKIDAEIAMQNVVDKENKLLKEQQSLIDTINDKNNKLQETKNNINSLNGDIKNKESEIKKLQEEKNSLSGHELTQHQAKIDHTQRELDELKRIKEQEESNLETILKQIKGKQSSLEETNKELSKLDQAKWKYEEIILKTVGLNSEKGKGLETISNEITRLEEQKRKLAELHANHKINTSEYQNQVGKIDTQIGRLQSAQGELRTMNKLAGKTIYKDINVKTNPTAGTINKQLGNPISKKVNVLLSMRQDQLKKRIENSIPNYVKRPSYLPSTPGYAEGTDYHPGGKAIAGEEGPELARMGNRWALLDFGLHDLPRGTQVFTHDETKKIINNLNRVNSVNTSPTKPETNNQQSAQIMLLQKQVELLSKILIKKNDVVIDGDALESAVSKRQANKYNNATYMMG